MSTVEITPIGAQVEERRVDECERDLRRIPLPQFSMPSMYPVEDVALISDKSQAPITRPRRFLDGEFESRARALALRGQQAVEIVGGCRPRRGGRKKVAGDARIR